MGFLAAHDIQKIKDDYQLDIFVETGTWLGDGVLTVLPFQFKEYHTIELLKDMYRKSLLRLYGHDNVFLYRGASSDYLPIILKNIDKNDRIFFWLDAHLPQVFGDVDTRSEGIIFPLESELKTIKSLRDCSHDYFLIDDLRIYEDRAYDGGIVPDEHKFTGERNIDFVFNMFRQTHNIERSLKNEGYIHIKPII